MRNTKKWFISRIVVVGTLYHPVVTTPFQLILPAAVQHPVVTIELTSITAVNL